MTDLSRSDVVAAPATAAGAKAFIVTPFTRLARAHFAGTMADAMVAAAFAGSLFFSLPASDARWPVLQYLLLTMLPFALLSPLVGPLIDRINGGHRFVVIGSAVLRGLFAYLLISQISGATPAFYLLALCLLVCQKAYQVGRSALVPSVVRSDRELVEANSKLSLLSGLASFAGAVPSAIVMKLFGPEWSLALATLTYLLAAGLATRLPPAKVAVSPPGEAEKHELRGAGIVLAGSAMGVLRWCVGFLTLLVAFDFRGDGVPWKLAVVGAATVASQLTGAAIAPRLRDRTQEENLLSGSLVVVVFGAVIAIVLGDVVGAAVLGASVGFSAAVGKLAFDSILQRDAPDANRGRAFARFETRFQVMWVVGALVPVWISMDARLGFTVLEVMAVFALASYTIGRLAWAHKAGVRQTAATAAALGIEARFAEVSGEFKGRVGRAGRRALRRPPRPAEGGDADLDDDLDDGWAGHVDEPGFDDVDDASLAGEAPGERVTEVLADGPAEVDPELGDDPDSWPEPEWADHSEFPWEPPTVAEEPTSAFLADVPESVDNPYPWTPDPTNPRNR